MVVETKVGVCRLATIRTTRKRIYSLLFSYQNLPCPHRVVSYLRHIFESHPETLHVGIMEGAVSIWPTRIECPQKVVSNGVESY